MEIQSRISQLWNTLLQSSYISPWLITIVAGVTFGLSLSYGPLWPIAFFSLAPFIALLLTPTTSRNASMQMGFVFFALFLGCIYFAMFWHALPLTWALVNPPPTQYALVGSAWFITICALAVPGIFIGYGVFHIKKSSYSPLIFIAAAWLCAEVIGAFILGLILYGKGSVLGAHLSISFVGNTLADSPFLILARVGGVFVLSSLVVSINTLAAYVLLRPLRGVVYPFLGNALYIFILFVIAHLPNNYYLSPVLITAINTQTPPLLSLTTAEEQIYKNRFDALVASSTGEFIVLPEASEYFPRKKREYITGALAATQGNIVIDSGKLRVGPQEVVRHAEYFDTTTHTSAFVYKHFLMPVGEYMPLFFQVLAYSFGENSSVAEMMEKRDYAKGPYPTPVTIHNIAISTLFCNEIWSPFLYASQAQAGATIFFNLASHTWYNNSSAIHSQVLRTARLRAVESSRSLIIANDLSPSVFISSNGKVLAETAWGKEGSITLSISPESTITPYSLLREWILVAPFILLFCYALLVFRKRKIDNTRITT